MSDTKACGKNFGHYVDDIRITINNLRIAINRNEGIDQKLNQLQDSYQNLFEFASAHSLLSIAEFAGRDDDAPRRDLERSLYMQEPRFNKQFKRYCQNRIREATNAAKER